jgi:hypothetical protein
MHASLHRLYQIGLLSTLLLNAKASSIIRRNTTQQWAFDQVGELLYSEYSTGY